MEDYFKNLLFASILVSLFGMLLLTAVVDVGDTYDKDTSEVVGGSLSMDKFNASISDLESEALSLQSRFEKGNIFSIVAGIVVEGVFGIGLTMMGLITTPFALVSNIMIDIFHVPAWVTTVLLAMLIMAGIFGIWRLIRIGD